MTSDRLVPNKRQSSLVAASLSFALTLLLQGCGSKPAPTCDRDDGCNGAEPGTFQRWVFAFEWQPTWAYDHCLDGHSPLEGHLKNDSFATSHLSIHGLWPEYFPSGPNNSLWPQFCTGAGVDFTDCNPPLAAKCKTSPATTSRYNTSQLWQQSAMEYAWGTLENYDHSPRAAVVSSASHIMCTFSVGASVHMGSVCQWDCQGSMQKIQRVCPMRKEDRALHRCGRV
eukprot:TRINITY_DN12425_c0_g1_i2.p1 TRINITY_DN12425_c0_g1~~TRINITY_DN12425_c0_g1_i2.p1  ORF type:complete len:226 (+),score=15.21 TRINITY_DN12425_c0_g1_i2:52-729(+)